LKVLRGGSAENSSNRWVKFDVELDESDYQQLLIENQLDAFDLTTLQKFNLLVKYAELLVTVRMEALGSTGDVHSSVLLQELKAFIEKLKGA
jgi:hypothetical protein